MEEAIAMLAEGAKLVAEGAGAAGLAAVLTFPERFAGREVGIPVCGSIDARDLSISARIAALGGNVIEVQHQQLFGAPTVQSTELHLMVEVREGAQGEQIIAALRARDDVVRRG